MRSRESVWLGSAAALAVGLPILAWAILQQAAPVLNWFVALCDGLAVTCMVIVALLGSLDANLRQNRRSLSIVFMAAATAIMWAGHFVLFPGDMPGVEGQPMNQASSSLFLAINLLTPLLLLLALLQRGGPLSNPMRAVVVANSSGVLLGLIVVGLSVAVGEKVQTISPSGEFTTLNALVGVAGLIPAAAGLLAFLSGRHGDERIAAGVLAALTFSALNSIALLYLHYRWSPAWYGDHLLALLPFVALLAGQLWLYTGSVVAERDALAEVASASERRRIGLDVAKAMAREIDLMPVVDRLLSGVMTAVNADRVTMLRIAGDEYVVERSSDRDALPARVGSTMQIGTVVAGGREVVAEAIEGKGPVLFGSYRVIGIDGDEVRAHAGILQSVAMPMLTGGAVDGVLVVGRRGDRPFTDNDVEQLEELAAIATLLIRNSRLLAEAESSSRAKSNFINLAAHELGTPISVIRGYVDMLADESLGPLSSRQRGPVEALRSTAADLGARVQQLLVAARLEGGAAPVVDGGEMLADLVEASRDAVERAAVRASLIHADITVSASSRTLDVAASPRDIALILDNLLNNAMTYTSPPARIRIEVKAAEMAELRVIDSGIGIPEDARERIFDQFYRIDDVEFGYPSGTGLGLFISRQLALRNAGELVLESSEAGKGSVFLLRLPKAAAV